MIQSVQARQRSREKFSRWYSDKTGGQNKPQPWLYGAPVYAPFLPGGGSVLRIHPHPKWPIELRNTRALHGMMTALTGPHQHVPPFSLIPWSCPSGWAVYFAHDDQAQRMAGRTHAAVLFDKPVSVSFSLLMKLRTPTVIRRGRQRVRVDAITPVSICSTGRTVTFTRPTDASLFGALGGSFLGRLGVSGISPEAICLRVVSADTQPVGVPTGGKWGTVRGWTGSCVVEVNAVARWLLECAGLIGLGGRTAIGMGRVRVTDAAR